MLDSETDYLYENFYIIVIFIFIVIFCLLLIIDNSNIQNSVIITYILISVFVIAVIFYLIAYQNISYKISYYYYAIQYQLNDVYNTDINYYNLLFTAFSKKKKKIDAGTHRNICTCALK